MASALLFDNEPSGRQASRINGNVADAFSQRLSELREAGGASQVLQKGVSFFTDEKNMGNLSVLYNRSPEISNRLIELAMGLCMAPIGVDFSDRKYSVEKQARENGLDQLSKAIADAAGAIRGGAHPVLTSNFKTGRIYVKDVKTETRPVEHSLDVPRQKVKNEDDATGMMKHTLQVLDAVAGAGVKSTEIVLRVSEEQLSPSKGPAWASVNESIAENWNGLVNGNSAQRLSAGDKEMLGSIRQRMASSGITFRVERVVPKMGALAAEIELLGENEKAGALAFIKSDGRKNDGQKFSKSEDVLGYMKQHPGEAIYFPKGTSNKAVDGIYDRKFRNAFYSKTETVTEAKDLQLALPLTNTLTNEFEIAASAKGEALRGYYLGVVDNLNNCNSSQDMVHLSSMNKRGEITPGSLALMPDRSMDIPKEDRYISAAQFSGDSGTGETHNEHIGLVVNFKNGQKYTFYFADLMELDASGKGAEGNASNSNGWSIVQSKGAEGGRQFADIRFNNVYCAVVLGGDKINFNEDGSAVSGRWPDMLSLLSSVKEGRTTGAVAVPQNYSPYDQEPHSVVFRQFENGTLQIYVDSKKVEESK